MISEITFSENQNGYGGSFWEEAKTYGKSWLHDKTQRTLLGYNEKNKQGQWELHAHHESYDEDKDEIVESSTILLTAETEQECIDFGKKYFGVKEPSEAI